MFCFTINAMLVISLTTLIDKYSDQFCQGYDIPRFLQNDYNVIRHYVKVIYFHPKYISQIRIDNVKPNRTYRAFSIYHCQLLDLDGDTWKINIHGYIATHGVRDTPLQFDIECCKTVASNIFGVQDAFKHSNYTKCPLKKGCYAMNNFVLSEANFPPFVPENVYLFKFKLYDKNVLVLQTEWHGEVRKKIK